jgi:hypothetical protein
VILIADFTNISLAKPPLDGYKVESVKIPTLQRIGWNERGDTG